MGEKQMRIRVKEAAAQAGPIAFKFYFPQNDTGTGILARKSTPLKKKAVVRVSDEKPTDPEDIKKYGTKSQLDHRRSHPARIPRL
jgi:hypothetical protein